MHAAPACPSSPPPVVAAALVHLTLRSVLAAHSSCCNLPSRRQAAAHSGHWVRPRATPLPRGCAPDAARLGLSEQLRRPFELRLASYGMYAAQRNHRCSRTQTKPCVPRGCIAQQFVYHTKLSGSMPRPPQVHLRSFARQAVRGESWHPVYVACCEVARPLGRQAHRNCKAWVP